MRNKVILLLIISLLNSKIDGLSGVGTSAVNFLKLPQGNRAAAMGNSYVAFAEGPDALYWNPAGLARGVFNEARMVYNTWIEGIYYGHVSYRQNMKIGGFGAAVTYLNSGLIVKRGNGRESLGSNYSLQDIAVNVGQGLKISDYVNLGISLQFIYESVDKNSVSSLSGGIGGQYRRKIDKHLLNIGVSVMNLGTKMGYGDKFPLPAVIRIGAGDELFNGRLIGSVEGDYHMVEGKITGGAGLEFKAAPFMYLRCGYRFGRRDVTFPYGLTAGLGIRYIETVEYNFDYSVTTIGDLGISNRIGLGIKF